MSRILKLEVAEVSFPGPDNKDIKSRFSYRTTLMQIIRAPKPGAQGVKFDEMELPLDIFDKLRAAGETEQITLTDKEHKELRDRVEVWDFGFCDRALQAFVRAVQNAPDAPHAVMKEAAE